MADRFLQGNILCASNQKSLSQLVLAGIYPNTCEFPRYYRTLDKHSTITPKIISMAQTMGPEIFLGTSQSPQKKVQMIVALWPVFPFLVSARLALFCAINIDDQSSSTSVLQKSHNPKTFKSSSKLVNVFTYCRLVTVWTEIRNRMQQQVLSNADTVRKGLGSLSWIQKAFATFFDKKKTKPCG